MAEAMAVCFDIDHHTQHEDRIFVAPPKEGNAFLTKAPRDILVVGPLLIVNPNLYVICMVRDPRDAIVSKHGKNRDNYWVGLGFWKAYSTRWKRLHRHPRFITVKYEDFVSDPDRVQGALSARMPFLRVKRPFSCFHEVAKPSKASQEAMGEARPIAPKSVGAWRDHLPRVAGQIRRHGSIADDLIEFGYETDDAWMKLLEGVEPDLAASHLEVPDLRKLQRGKYKEVVKHLLRSVGVEPSRLRLARRS